MGALEVELLQGQNTALADLFDLDHARKVLGAFGRAFGKLPENISDSTREQKDFLKQSVAGLMEDGKVICVRLALFAEMMKGKEWSPVSPTQLAPVRTLLESHKAEIVPDYWQIALDDKQSAIRRFHAASALASFDPSNAAWDESKFAAFVSDQLVAVSPTYVSQYQELVRPVSAKLIPALTVIFKDPARGELARTLATSLLADCAAQDPATLVDLVLAADASSDKALFPVLKKHLDVAVKRFESILDRSVNPNWHDGPLDTNWVEPDATIQAYMESAHGMIGERFA